MSESTPGDGWPHLQDGPDDDLPACGNQYLVGSQARRTIIALPPREGMTSDETMVLAAWLLIVAEANLPVGQDLDERFSRIRQRITQ